MGAILIRDDLLSAIKQEVEAGAVASVEAYVEWALEGVLQGRGAAPPLTSEAELANIIDVSLADVEAGYLVPGEQVIADLHTAAEAIRRVRDTALG